MLSTVTQNLGKDIQKQRERTFEFEESLPSLPVPPLEETLQKYLESVKVFASEDEYLNTERLVQEFENGVGSKLQQKLEEKALYNRNWLEEWWEDLAYLSVREPLAVLGSMAGFSPIVDSFWPIMGGTQIKRAAMNMYGFAKYLSLLRREEVPVMRSASGTVFSMYQYRRFFCTSRIPGKPKDTLVSYFKTEREGPCPSHGVVLYNGHIFKMDLFEKDGHQLGTNEIERQLRSIKERSKVLGQRIGMLTADDRTSWAEAHSHLVSLDPQNARNLETIRSAIMAFSLDEEAPKTKNEAMTACFAGKHGYDRWFDKSSSEIFFSNGIIGYVADHCPYEGIIISLIGNWIDDLITRSKTDWLGSTELQSDNVCPEELEFRTDDKIEKAIDHATETYTTQAERMEFCASNFNIYGRNLLKAQKIHPDIYFQLALQLAYYNMYGRPAPCYETATARKFYHGRTETVRCTTQEAVDWSKAMNHPSTSVKERVSLLKAAANKQMMIGFDCLEGRGIDRHLLGLYATSREMGMDPPALFLDPVFYKSGGNGNFVLSTSQVGYRPAYGGVAPMVHNGYGIFYNLCKEHFFIFVTSFKDCEETNSVKFFQEISKALLRMEELLLESKL